MPLVSIIVPNRNHGNLLPELFASLRKDSLAKEFELILLDDDSSDDSLDTIRSETIDCPFPVRVVEIKENIGPVRANMKGLDLVRTPYCMFRSADDLCENGFIEKAVRTLEENHQVGLCAGALAYFEKDRERCSVEAPLPFTSAKVLMPLELAQTIKGNTLYTHSCLFRTEAARQLGGMNANLKWYADWFFTMKLAFMTGIVYMPEIGCRCRLNTESYGMNSLLNKKSQSQVFEALLDELLHERNEEVFGLFCQSSATGFFPSEILVPFFNQKRFWTNKAIMLLQLPLWRWNAAQEEQSNQGIFQVISKKLNASQKRIHNVWLKGDRDGIFVYGAGLHTQKLISAWKLHDLPPISGIIVSKRENSQSEVLGFPLHQSDELDGNEPCLIVISSKSFQSQMRAECQRRFPQAELLEFWN